MKLDMTLLKELTELPGVPGNEKQVASYVLKKIEPHVDQILKDNIGSLIGVKGNQGPKILLGSHLDEVGLMVTNITKEGFLKFQTLGGWLPQVLLAQEWEIHTKQGVYFGVTGAKASHTVAPDKKNQMTPINQMYIDIGVSSKEEAEQLGVLPGSMIVPHTKFKTLANPDYLLAKAFDNRVGVAIVIEVLKRLNRHPNTVYGSFTVLEEVGLRGARTTGYLVNPDLAIAVDAGLAGDVPGGEKDEQTLGAGPQIILYDASMVGHQTLRAFVKEVAKSKKIPYQETYIARGGSDAGQYHLSHQGAPSVLITVPTRYLHTHTSIIHKTDYEHAVQLVLALIEVLDAKAVQDIIEN